ncbi:MAG: TetR family transcriptional regulator C-terminal domain-containing protein [Beijerinckiaceae bacterium]
MGAVRHREVAVLKRWMVDGKLNDVEPLHLPFQILATIRHGADWCTKTFSEPTFKRSHSDVQSAQPRSLRTNCRIPLTETAHAYSLIINK